MAQEFKKKPVVSNLPAISLVSGFHHPLVSLTRTARHLSLSPDATYRSVQTADFALSVVTNVSKLRLDATAPISSRFARMLEAIS